MPEKPCHRVIQCDEQCGPTYGPCVFFLCSGHFNSPVGQMEGKEGGT